MGKRVITRFPYKFSVSIFQFIFLRNRDRQEEIERSRNELENRNFLLNFYYFLTSLRRIPSVFCVDFLLRLNGLLYSLCAP